MKLFKTLLRNAYRVTEVARETVKLAIVKAVNVMFDWIGQAIDSLAPTRLSGRRRLRLVRN